MKLKTKMPAILIGFMLAILFFSFFRIGPLEVGATDYYSEMLPIGVTYIQSPEASAWTSFIYGTNISYVDNANSATVIYGIYAYLTSPGSNYKAKYALYDSGLNWLASTEEYYGTAPNTLNFTTPVTFTNNTKYWLVVWGENWYAYYYTAGVPLYNSLNMKSFNFSSGQTYNGTFPTTLTPTSYTPSQFVVYGLYGTNETAIMDNTAYADKNRGMAANSWSTGIYASAMGHTFTASANYLMTKAQFKMSYVGSPPGNITANLYAVTGTVGTNAIPSGSPLAISKPFNLTHILWYNYNTFTFTTPYLLHNGTDYAIDIENPTSGISTSNYPTMLANSSNLFAGNSFDYRNSAWNITVATWDNMIIIYALATPTTPPQYHNLGSTVGETTLLSSNWTGANMIGGKYFIQHNETGTVVNTTGTFTSNPQWANLTINTPFRSVTSWKVYANDTYDNWNSTSLQTSANGGTLLLQNGGFELGALTYWNWESGYAWQISTYRPWISGPHTGTYFVSLLVGYYGPFRFSQSLHYVSSNIVTNVSVWSGLSDGGSSLTVNYTDGTNSSVTLPYSSDWIQTTLSLTAGKVLDSLICIQTTNNVGICLDDFAEPTNIPDFTVNTNIDGENPLFTLNGTEYVSPQSMNLANGTYVITFNLTAVQGQYTWANYSFPATRFNNTYVLTVSDSGLMTVYGNYQIVPPQVYHVTWYIPVLGKIGDIMGAFGVIALLYGRIKTLKEGLQAMVITVIIAIVFFIIWFIMEYLEALV